MKFLFSILFLGILGYSVNAVDLTRPRPTRATTTQTPTTTQDPRTILTSCGQTLFGSNGVIEYKLAENYTELERCSFVIRAEGYTNFVFTLEENELALDSSISILSFKEPSLMESTILGPINPLKQAFVRGDIAVVVFSSKKAIGKGFRLRFEGLKEQGYSTRGNQTVFSSTSGQIEFSRVWNGPEPVGTFEVYVISENHHETLSYKQIVLEATKMKMDVMQSQVSCGRDSLNVYSFNEETVKHEGIVCDVHYNKRVFETRGIFIVMFRNFGDNSAKSFTLDWNVQ